MTDDDVTYIFLGPPGTLLPPFYKASFLRIWKTTEHDCKSPENTGNWGQEVNAACQTLQTAAAPSPQGRPARFSSSAEKLLLWPSTPHNPNWSSLSRFGLWPLFCTKLTPSFEESSKKALLQVGAFHLKKSREKYWTNRPACTGQSPHNQ